MRGGVFSILIAAALVTSFEDARAGTYSFHPASVLKLGGTFDPQNLTVGYSSCIRYDREYPVHALGRKDGVPLMITGAVNSPQPSLPPADEPPKAPRSNIAADNNLSIEQIKTREHLYKFLNISTSISGQYKFFSASASFNYESEEAFDSDSFVFGVRGMTTWGELGLVNPQLTSEARALVNNRPAFYTRCGREWVSTETRGVLIAVVYTIKNVSQSQRSKLEAAVSGGFGGAILKLNVEAKMTKIFEQAFVSNYYSARVTAIGGAGVSEFAETLNKLEEPGQVISKISDYMKKLNYETSVPLMFTTGSLDQFLAQDGEILLFDTFNRRIADLFLSFENYRARRAQVWKFLNDDGQSAWGDHIDLPVWEYLKKLDSVTAAIEARAQACKMAASSASTVSMRNRTNTLIDQKRRDYVIEFTSGISSKLVGSSSRGIAMSLSSKKGDDSKVDDCTDFRKVDDEVDRARGALCECLKKDDSVYLQQRLPVASVPTVKVIHDKTTFAPRTLLYISVVTAGRLTNVELKDQLGETVQKFRGGVDPDNGPTFYGSVLYRNGSGSPPDLEKLPYYVEMTDSLGRMYLKPVIILD